MKSWVISLNFLKNFRAKKVSLSLLVFSSFVILPSFVSCTGYTKLNKKLDELNITLEDLNKKSKKLVTLATETQQIADENSQIIKNILQLLEKYESKSGSSSKKRDGFENFCYPSDCSIPYQNSF